MTSPDTNAARSEARNAALRGEAEGEILDEYQRLANDKDRSAAFRYLAAMILEDEVRHHKLFADMATTMRQMSEVRSEDEPIPSVRGLRADRESVMDATNRLLEVERSDAKELKRLAKEFEDFNETSLWGLLIELMRDDTDKHIKILRFIQERAQDKY